MNRRDFIKIGTTGLTAVVVASILLAGCAAEKMTIPHKSSARAEFYVDKKSGPNPWTHLNFHNDPNNFQFAVAGDLTGRERPYVFNDAVRKLNLLQPEFVMSVGDLIDGDTTNPDELKAQWQDFINNLKPLEIPFFPVPGNHDWWYPVQKGEKLENYYIGFAWKEYWGRSYYHFIYRNVLFLILNDNLSSRDADFQKQKEYIQKVLDETQDVRWTFTFFHQPKWKFILPMLEERKRKFTAFAGHTHYYNYVGSGNDNEHDRITLATTGGMSNMRGIQYGEFDHIVWVTMTEDGPRIANLLLDGIYDKKVRTPLSYGLMKTVLENPPVTTTAIFHDDSFFQKKHIRLNLKNPNQAPLHLKCSFESHKYLHIQPATIDIILSGNAEHDFDVFLSAERPVPTLQIAPVVIDWNATYELSDQPDVVAAGKARLIIEPSGPIPRPSKPDISEDFDGPELSKDWIALGSGGIFNGNGQFVLKDDPFLPHAENCQYTDGMGRYNLTKFLWSPSSGVFKDIPPDTFEAQLKISNINWVGEKRVFHWEFWDNPSRWFHYGPKFNTGIAVKIKEDNGKPVISIGEILDLRYKELGKVQFPSVFDSVTLRANWRESTHSWEFYYGINGREPLTEIPGGRITETTPAAPEGKRNLMYIEQNDTKERAGFSVGIDQYDIFHLR